jgi:CheY-like chemotaxis protein
MARITVAHDSLEFLDLVHDILQGDRYETTLIYGNRDDALQLIRQSRPDLLMIDLRMGGDGVRGWNTAQEVRANAGFEGLPVLICGADLQALSEIEPDLAASRHVAALTIPFEIDELTQSIDRLLGEIPRDEQTIPVTGGVREELHFWPL